MIYCNNDKITKKYLPFKRKKCQGLDKCFLPFIISVHKQCVYHPFFVSLHILQHRQLHTGVYQNWSVRSSNSRVYMLSSTTFTVEMNLLSSHIQVKFKTSTDRQNNNGPLQSVANQFPRPCMGWVTSSMGFFSKRQEVRHLVMWLMHLFLAQADAFSHDNLKYIYFWWNRFVLLLF